MVKGCKEGRQVWEGEAMGKEPSTENLRERREGSSCSLIEEPQWKEANIGRVKSNKRREGNGMRHCALVCDFTSYKPGHLPT